MCSVNKTNPEHSYTTWVRGVACKNNVLGPKLEGAGYGSIQNNVLLIYATVEASNFKCGTQIGFGTSLAKNNI